MANEGSLPNRGEGSLPKISVKGGRVAKGASGIPEGAEAHRLRQPTWNIWTDYDPETVRRGLRESAGALAGVDREALLRDIHRDREQVSSPSFPHLSESR